MNTQRWLVVLVVGSIAAVFATRRLWLPSPEAEEAVGEADEDEEAMAEPLPTPAPFTEADESITPSPEAPQSGLIMEEEAMMDEGEMMEETVLQGGGGPFILAAGSFVEIDALHGGEGAATIYQAPDGNRFVRLEPFSVTDAPDLRVALSSSPAPRTQNDLTASSGFLDLGALESTQGAQNYDIPLNVRLEQFESVVIYDRQFNIIFTTATLER
jgi:hypothetical protein